MTTTAPRVDTGPVATPDRPPVAWRPVLAIAAGVALVLGVASAWYGYFGDELYFLSAGARPAWGYADQPPLMPLLAAALDHLAPGNLVVLRLPATLAAAGNVVLAALLTAELGGRRRAQLLAAGAIAISPYLLATSHLLATSTIDPFLWSLLLWLLVRWLRTDRDGHPRDRLLLAAGPVLALTLFDKLLVPVLLAALAVGVLIAGPRRLLGRPLLWVALVLAAASTVPTLLWQAAHGWPMAQMGPVVAGEAGLTGNRWVFLPYAAWDIGLLPGIVLAGLGGWALLRSPVMRPWRAVGIAVPVATVVMLAAGGRPYYVMGMAAVLVAAGAVAVQEHPPRRWWGWTLSVPAYVLSALVVVVLALPVGPSRWRVDSDFVAMGQVGWASLAADSTAAYRSLPPAQREHTTVLAFSYWYASALDRYGPPHGLPPVHSGHRGFGYFGPPPDSATTALLVGPVKRAQEFCAVITPLPDHVDPDANAGMNGVVPLGLCTPRAPWSVLWPQIMDMY
jgi:4-amino-4-deoxy-L-arabinose transferase-like glycosyltransferase